MPSAPEFAFAVVHFSLILSVTIAVARDEVDILLSFKSAIHESGSGVFSSWTTNNSICNYTGITCSTDGFVTEIELSNRNLSGSPRLDLVCGLRFLEKLSLGQNNLDGTISRDLNNCHRLRYLDLGNNLFNGFFPEISSLSDLRVLYLNNTGITGTFPWESLKNITNLVRLSLGDNPFDNTTFPVEIIRLSDLEWLYLSNCSIEGEIPSGLGNLTKLRNLELSDNYLNGEIPADIVKLTNLWQLELYSNGLTGQLPAGLGNLTKLQYFDVSENNLGGDISVVRWMTNLISLQLFMNEFTGEVPPELGEFRQLVNLSLYKNKFTGKLPWNLGSWSAFNFIDASENFFTGPIPPDMCRHGAMKKLLLLQNQLSGEIPATYANCTTLVRFRVNNNNLTGRVPEGIWSLPEMTIIDVRQNNLEGSIPPGISKAKSLAQLYAGNNKLSGTLPPDISETFQLVLIHLNDNQLTGGIPAEIGKLLRLGSFHLQNNNLSGNIPESIGSCRSLTDVNLANNLLSGEITPAFGLLSTLNSLNLSGNRLSGRIPATLSFLGLSLLDLSDNDLAGLIPPSLSIEAYNGSFAGNQNLCSENVSSFRRCSSDSGAIKSYRVLIVCLAFASAILTGLLICFIRSKRKELDGGGGGGGLSSRGGTWNLKSFQVFSFTEEEIVDSIKPENLIGRGGSGDVYRVTLSTGKDLAVKHIWNTGVGKESRGRRRRRSSSPILAKRCLRDRSREFDAEVRILSCIRHVNVVSLYCSITSEDSNLLVYDHMPNGSLWDRLHTCHKLVLDWETRYDIALGSAKGLEYLHHGCERPIIHRDVKSGNILLDEFLKPRIADFGLSKIVPAHPHNDSTHTIAGTPGYFAPEYGYTCKVNEKSDVYSFGVVLMELATRKRPVEAEFGESVDIVRWVCSKLKGNESLIDAVDVTLPHGAREEALKVLKVALLCTVQMPDQRPTMRLVVKMLEAAEPCRLLDVVVDKGGVKMISSFDKIKVASSE